MAPTITAQEHLTLSHKVRKPLVEKLRRERINSSIEQLKCLLAPELVQQQPDSKLEKADVLEMTVCFLTRLQQQRRRRSRAADSADRGFSRCVREVEDFLTEEEEEVKTRPQRRGMMMKTLDRLRSSSEQKLREADFSPPSSAVTLKGPVSGAPWRPWSTPEDRS
ncbi:transcription factor HES-5-like [Scophthalmus maximus]|uniref:transcription factor HES-5-like n=1 Tax=Scophthalmus maximus TaxID=52904 RepID=UPI0015E159FA|nr:transcription factor HES-5-like [Scophthalmus maximus]